MKIESSVTRTFLFTDIEGSTRLWERDPVAMGVALARHDALLRAAVAIHEGRVFSTAGDAFCAVFADAQLALAAARAAQIALSQERWPDNAPIKVRVALHTGVAEVRNEDYFGPPLNRAARLLAAAHGGQVLLSNATEELIRNHLPEGVALRDMGERRLKDLIRPERVYQVLAPELEAEFPPLKTLDARVHNLPIQLTSFVGREQELKNVKALLRSSRLVTMTGAGGAGKTRLALQVAAEVLDDYADGVRIVEFAALRDEGFCFQAVAREFGVKEEVGLTLQDSLITYLRKRELLLLLDNCEHLIRACAEVVQAILSATPNVRVLATSREVLRVSGEATFRVPSLATPDAEEPCNVDRLAQYAAVQLFVERARSVQPAFLMTDLNASLVASICCHLDGIPLAIELAAARIRTLTVHELDHRLDERFRLLTGGLRTALPRQQTLRGAIDWSYDLLVKNERTALARLAVFAGACTLDAAETICATDEISRADVLDLLTALFDKSLILINHDNGTARYSLLETVRQYAREKLVQLGASSETEDRHRLYYLRLVESAEPELIGSAQAGCLRRLDDERENLRAALERSVADRDPGVGLRLCGALQRYWIVRGYLSEGRDWCRRLLSRPAADENTRERSKAANAAAMLAFSQSDYEVARELAFEALSIGRRLNDSLCISNSTNTLGNIAHEQGDLASARDFYIESRNLSLQLGNEAAVARALNNLGNMAAEQEDYASARSFMNDGLTIARALGDRVSVGLFLNNLALVTYSQGDYATASVLSRESLEISREIGNRHGAAFSTNILAVVAFEEGDYPNAGVLYRDSLETMHDLDYGRGISDVLEGLASLAAASGHPVRAATTWGAMERLREDIGSPIQPQLLPAYLSGVEAARVALGDDPAFERAWQEGRAMSVNEAVAYALEKRPGDASDTSAQFRT